MTQLELIDRLCAVTTEMTQIIREQEFIIEQHRLLDKETGREFAAKRNAIDTELDIIEVGLRPLVPFTCGKEE